MLRHLIDASASSANYVHVATSTLHAPPALFTN